MPITASTWIEDSRRSPPSSPRQTVCLPVSSSSNPVRRWCFGWAEPPDPCTERPCGRRVAPSGRHRSSGSPSSRAPSKTRWRASSSSAPRRKATRPSSMPGRLRPGRFGKPTRPVGSRPPTPRGSPPGQDPETGKYRLGPEMLQLGNAFLDHHELRGRSLVWADTLAERVGESVRVGVLYGRRVLVVHHVFRPDDSVQILEVGASVPWHASALGKVHAASLPADRRRTLVSGPLQRLTGRTIVDPHALALALEEVAAAGFPTEAQEAVIGDGEVAAAVFDHRGHPVGAIGVVGPVARLLPGGPPAELVIALTDTARRLSWEMGARRGRPGSVGHPAPRASVG